MLEEPRPHLDSITKIGIKGIRGEPARVLRGLWKDPLMRGRIKALQKHDPPPGGWRDTSGTRVSQGFGVSQENRQKISSVRKFDLIFLFLKESGKP